MRPRWLRFIPIPKTGTTPDENLILGLSARNVLDESIPDQTLVTVSLTDDKSIELSWWDHTVFLLHTAAEIEHSLMVQYLYALYSLGEPPFRGPKIPNNATDLVKQWRSELVEVARQEMAHLATVQNLLRFIGGPLNFEREDFPFRNLFYPFKFNLEPLSKTSLAKYVSAEMPEDPGEPSLISEIVARATHSNNALPINQVGKLYEQLISIFKDQNKMGDQYLRPDSATKLQAKPSDWFSSGKLLVRQISSREEAIDALIVIAEQGEGTRTPPSDSSVTAPSHFQIFLDMYKKFPETDDTIAAIDWIPTRLVPFNPTTSSYESANSQITNSLSLLWAHLFNVRYRMLLMYLSHALVLEGPMIANNEKTIRGFLRDWTFNEMRGSSISGLSGLAQKACIFTSKGK